LRKSRIGHNNSDFFFIEAAVETPQKFHTGNFFKKIIGIPAAEPVLATHL
jgi:hypothetical protein